MAYANPNYDPVKAHEYYEKHKKLKGNRSTKGMSEEQKITLKYGKEQLYEEHKQRLSNITAESKQKKERLRTAHKEWKSEAKQWKDNEIKKIREEAKRQKEQMKASMNFRIDALKAKMANMSPEEKAKFKDQLNTAVVSLRAQYGRASDTIDTAAQINKESFMSDYNSKVSRANEVHNEAMQETTNRAKEERSQESVEYNKVLDDWYEKVRKKGK